MKGQVAQRAQPVVGDELGLRIALPDGFALMKMSKRKELSGENQGGAGKRNRLCAAANPRPNASSP